MWQVILLVFIVIAVIAAIVYFSTRSSTNSPNISLTENPTDLKISWNAVENVDSYKVLVGSEPGKYTQTFSTKDTTYSIKKDICRKYYIAVKSVKDNCESTASNEVFAETKIGTTAIKQMIKRGDRLYVTLDPVSGAQGYAIEAGPNDRDFPWKNRSQHTTVDVLIPTSDCIDIYVRAYALAQDCQSVASDTKIYSQKTPSTNIISIDSSLLMTWDKIEGVKEYIVMKRKEGEPDFKEVAKVQTNTYRLQNIDCGQNYLFVVKTSNNGCSSTSNEFKFIRPLPNAPTGIKVE